MQFKSLTLLALLLDREGQEGPSETVFKSLLKSLERYEEASEAGDCYERVYALWNYGQVLSRKDATRLEGRDYID